MSEIEFRAVLSAEELNAMVKEHVARSIRGHRVSFNEDGEPVDWEENLLGPMLRNEVKIQVGAALEKRLEGLIAEIVTTGLKEGFYVKGDGYGAQEQRLTLKEWVTRHLTRKTREGNYSNNPELTAPERVIAAVVEDALRKDFAKVLEELTQKFKAALTQKFTDAAAEALRRAVNL